MKIKKPKFWDLKKPNLTAFLLLPLTIPYSLYNLFRKRGKTNFSKIKTICVGNIYLGGTGKTPLSVKISELLNKENLKSTIIKKYYIDQIDEQELIEKKTNLICQRNRINCLNEAIIKNFKYAIFDDGLQDDSINYDIKICCFSSKHWIGNSFLIPAGPLREKIKSIKNFDIVFLNFAKSDNHQIKKKILEINKGIKIFESNYKPMNLNEFNLSISYVAISAIGNPENFENTLKDNHFKLIKHFSFPDHYNFKEIELNNIKKFAKENNAKIVTTEKDYLRINKKNRENIDLLKMEITINNEDKLLKLII